MSNRFTKSEIQTWVKYLRDNPDKQTSNVLKTAGGYMCCLGALCEVMNVKQTLGDIYSLYDFHFDDGRTSDSCVKGSISTRLGSSSGDLSDRNIWRKSFIKYKIEYYSLASANDRGVPWSVIADFIEENYITSD